MLLNVCANKLIFCFNLFVCVCVCVWLFECAKLLYNSLCQSVRQYETLLGKYDLHGCYSRNESSSLCVEISDSNERPVFNLLGPLVCQPGYKNVRIKNALSFFYLILFLFANICSWKRFASIFFFIHDFMYFPTDQCCYPCLNVYTSNMCGNVILFSKYIFYINA